MKTDLIKTPAMLFIFSGLPASGKTTLAMKLSQHLGAMYLRVDTIEASLRDGTEIPQLGEKCYRVAHFIAQENLRLGHSVIGDCVNPWELTRNAWNEVASSVGAHYLNFEIRCSNQEEHRLRLERRGVSMPGLKEPTWQEVQERDYHSWEQERIFIDTSDESVDQSFDQLISKWNERQMR